VCELSAFEPWLIITTIYSARTLGWMIKIKRHQGPFKID
jgi:hypothetical protein